MQTAALPGDQYGRRRWARGSRACAPPLGEAWRLAARAPGLMACSLLSPVTVLSIGGIVPRPPGATRERYNLRPGEGYVYAAYY